MNVSAVFLVGVSSFPEVRYIVSGSLLSTVNYTNCFNFVAHRTAWRHFIIVAFFCSFAQCTIQINGVNLNFSYSDFNNRCVCLSRSKCMTGAVKHFNCRCWVGWLSNCTRWSHFLFQKQFIRSMSANYVEELCVTQFSSDSYK